MITKSTLQTFLSIVEKLVNMHRALFVSMQKEFESLKKNNIELLELALEEKQSIIVQLVDFEKNLHAFFTKLDLSVSKQDINTFISSVDVAHQENSRFRWQELCEVLKRCDKQNSINNKLILINQTNTSSVLSILRGQLDVYDKFYDPSGKSVNELQSNSLAKA